MRGQEAELAAPRTAELSPVLAAAVTRDRDRDKLLRLEAQLINVVNSNQCVPRPGFLPSRPLRRLHRLTPC